MSIRNLIIIILVVVVLLLLICPTNSNVQENWGTTNLVGNTDSLRFNNELLCCAKKHNVVYRDPCKTPMELANMVERTENKQENKDRIYTVESNDLPMSSMDSIDSGDPFNIPKVVSINHGVMLEQNKYTSKADLMRGDLPIPPVSSLWGNSIGADVQNLRLGAFNIFDNANGVRIAELKRDALLAKGVKSNC